MTWHILSITLQALLVAAALAAAVWTGLRDRRSHDDARKGGDAPGR